MSKADNNKDKQPNQEELQSTASYDIPICGPGTRIGQFCIKEEIGRGGMGVVYLALDTNLDRQVAIKSIPPMLTDNAKVKSRFRREAKLLASLDHPDIATIYEFIEDEKGIGYLVLEYIPGDTLADCIAQGPMPLKEVLSLSGQIGNAFASAHEHGIVHRDLKPANIKITPDRRIKVLDFGIAKAVGNPGSNVYTTVTEPGQLIGTPSYMSPEQARGKPTDERGDIWSFGCVLYEMLTGKHPFEGETASDTLVGVLEREPDWDVLPQATPANVKVLIRRCLEKDPQQRLQHMGDVALEIRETLNLPAVVPPMTVSAMTVAQPATLNRSIITKVAALVLTAVVVTGLICWSLFRSSPPPLPSTVKFSIPLTPTEKTALIHAGTIRLVLSPDGKLLVLSSPRGEKTQLFVRSLDNFEIKPIPGTENAYGPSFSPDSQWLAFFTQDASGKRSLWKLRINQKEHRVLLAESQHLFSRQGSWSDDDLIFFSGLDEHKSKAIFQVPAAGGTPEPLSSENLKTFRFFYPRGLPDGKTVMYCTDDAISLLSRVTGKSTVLLRNARGGQYSHTGHLLFIRDRQLFAAAFDVDALKITGPEVLVIRDIPDAGLNSSWNFSIARNGTLAYMPLPSEAPSLVWVDRQGNIAPVTGLPDRHYLSPRLSPDDTELVATIVENDRRDIWKYNLNRHVSTQLTFGRPTAIWPNWIPSDANRISFCSQRDSSVYRPQLYSVSMDSTVEPILPIDHDFWRAPLSWSPDGRYLAYREGLLTTPRIWVLPFGDDGKPGEPVLFLDEKHCALGMRFHPSDGRCVAYSSDKTGKYEVYIKEFVWGNLNKGWVEKVSVEGGTEPCWSRDGSKLYYRSPKGMMEVTVDSKSGGTAELGKSQILFEDSIYSTDWLGYTNYDVASDGRFLMIKDARPTQINVILNFDEELKRLAPTGKK